MSKEKQIEEMALELCRPRNIVKMIHHRACGNCDTSSCDIYELCVDLYNAGYRKSERISVEERLPECEQGAESKAVLFITKQGFMYTGYYGCGGIFHDRYFREFKNATEGCDISNVTHWMPLPEPPKKGGAE